MNATTDTRHIAKAEQTNAKAAADAIHNRYLPENHSPEVAKLHEQSTALNLHEFWSERLKIESLAIPRRAVPYVWKWRDIQPHLMNAAKVIEMEDGDAERRAVIFVNPGLNGARATTSTMFGAFSCYLPGERSAAHRHTPNASRFGVQGKGGYTTVNGEKCTLNRGDLVLTPAGSWHDHGNDSDTDTIIWADVLDMPLIVNLNAPYFDLQHKDENAAPGSERSLAYQVPRFAHDYSNKVYGQGGLLPRFINHGTRVISGHSPMYEYRWENTEALLHTLRDHEGSPYDGIVVEYRDPINNRPVLPTMSFVVRMLRPGEATLPKREMSSSIFFCMKGKGRTEIEGTVIEWEENDVFCIPNWMWAKHSNASSTEQAILYSVTDEPTMRKLSQYRAQGKQGDGSIIELASSADGALIF